MTYLVHRRTPAIGIKAGHSLHGATEQPTEELVQMRQKEAELIIMVSNDS